MAEQDKNELIWARNTANGVPKEMTRKKLDMLSGAPNSGWEECDEPASSPHAGIVIVHHDEDGQEIAHAPAGGLEHPSTAATDPQGEQSPAPDQTESATTAAKQKKETA